MLDIRTVLFMGSLSFLICTLLLWFLRLRVGRRIRGVGSWALGFLLEVSGILLVALRGILPDLVSILAANLFVQAGIVLIYSGYARFVGLRRRVWPAALLVGVFGLVHAYFTFVHPDLEARNLNVVVCMSILCVLIALVLFASPTVRTQARFCAWINLGYVAVNVLRGAAILDLAPHGQDFLRSGQIEGLWQLAYQILFLVQTAGMVSLVLERFNEDLAESEEKFSKAFHSSPCAIAIIDAENGIIEEVNEAFSQISGHQEGESVGKTSTELGLWLDSGRRGPLLDRILSVGLIPWTDLRFRAKDGSAIDALAAAESLTIGGRKAVLWTVNDISERKRMEESIRTLLKEKETLLKEIHHRVKNNMASVAGLLSLEAVKLGEEDKAGAVLEEAAGQVRSMAVLYDRIYSTEHYESMPLSEFLPPLVRENVDAYSYAKSVALDLILDDRLVPPRLLLPLGMVATEIVCNAMKYAFAGRERGAFSVRSSGDPGLVLEFADDGPGFDAASRREGGFGFSLVQALAEQMHGRVSIDGSHGCRVSLELDRLG
jgi:PAS domain S-box-containing protein